MKKGYFFSLEVLVSILVIISSLLVYNANPKEIVSNDERIYEALDLLERQNKLDSENLETELERILGFDIKVNDDCNDLKYMFVVDSRIFRTINICY